MSRRNVRQTRRADDGAGGFLPTQLAGCVLWLRSDLGISLNGSTVSAWADQSGQGNSVTQGVAGQQPAYNASDASYGGRPSLSFAQASAQLLKSSVAIATTAQPITLVIVGEGSQAVGAQWLLCVGAGTNCGIEDAGTSSPGKLSMYAGSFVFITAADTTAVFAAVLNGASSKLFRNSSQTPVGTGNPGTGSLSSNVFIGSNGGGGQNLQGKVAEAIIYTRDLSADGSLGQLFQYLGSTYQLPAT